MILRTLIAAAIVSSAAFIAAAQSSSGPHIAREDIEWSHTWVMGVNRHDKPHVLLIGDSITEAVFGQVEARLNARAYLCKLTTSKSLGDPLLLDEVALMLKNTHFEVIHFNNGMHGAGYTEAEYRRDYVKLLKVLKAGAPTARVVLVTTTAQRTPGKLDQLTAFNERIKVRNIVVKELASKANLPVNDLFSLVENHPEYFSNDGTHLSGPGIDAQADKVVGILEPLLK